MRHRIRQIALLLVLGAIINVAVAWACVRLGTESSDGYQIGFPSSEDAWLRSLGWDPSQFTTETPEEISNPIMPKHWAIDPGKANVEAQATHQGWLDQWSVSYLGHEVRRFDWTMSTQRYPFPPVAGQFRAGIPMHALYGECHVNAAGPEQFLELMNSRGLRYEFEYLWQPLRDTTNASAFSNTFSGGLPLLPLWPGFAINTMFYAGALWLLFAAPFALRRRGRIRRGLCPSCAYPVGASDVCTECGERLRQ